MTKRVRTQCPFSAFVFKYMHWACQHKVYADSGALSGLMGTTGTTPSVGLPTKPTNKTNKLWHL